MQEDVRFHSDLSPEALRSALSAIVEPTDWPPPLTFKLSGGGIVSRVMEAPETAQPFFGRVDAEKIRIARSSRGRQVTPFQPILLATITEASGGSQLALTLRPHRQARSLSGLFAVAGFTLIGASLPAILTGEPLGIVAMLLGVVFMLFPSWRARTCFRTDRTDALSALTAALPIERA